MSFNVARCYESCFFVGEKYCVEEKFSAAARPLYMAAPLLVTFRRPCILILYHYHRMACTVYCPSKDGFLPFHSLGMHKYIPILIVSYVGKDTFTHILCVHTITTYKVYQPHDSIWEKGPLWTEWTLIWHYHEQISILSFKMTHKGLLKWWMDFEHL